ncbi:unnamed protein product [Clonostachys rhizophaga]|uniref:F-box domain-containing protein n=1 Tax=Clonostachys rhizophaga TaxID=160324 RepID=A0A9N9VUM0_9HYPO|nr:unnamed protein product [Clonostachys rhizophaga]
MAMLIDLPAEILHHVCKQLSGSTDVCNFRLVCRAFGDIGLFSLAPTISFTLSRRGLARLRDICSHPVLRHYVYSIVFLTEVLRPYSDFESWRQKSDWGTDLDFDENEGDLDDGREVFDATIFDRWSVYESLLASQEQVFSGLQSPRIRTLFQSLPNLTHLRFKCSDTPNGLIHDTEPKVVKEQDVVGWRGNPDYPFPGRSPCIGLAGTKPLRLLSHALQPQLTSLEVDRLDLDFFYGEESELDAICQLQNIRLGLIYTDPETGWFVDKPSVVKAKLTLSKSRFKAFFGLYVARARKATVIEYSDHLDTLLSSPIFSQTDP